MHRIGKNIIERVTSQRFLKEIGRYILFLREVISGVTGKLSLTKTFSATFKLIDQIHLICKGILRKVNDWDILEKIGKCIVFMREIISRFVDDFSRTKIFLKASRLIGKWAKLHRAPQTYRPVCVPVTDSQERQVRKTFLDPERETVLRWRGIGLILALGTAILVTSIWLSDTAPSQGTKEYAPQPVVLPTGR